MKPPIHITPLLEAFDSDGDEYVSDSDNVGANNTTVVENEWEEEFVISEDPSSTTNEEVDVNPQQPKATEAKCTCFFNGIKAIVPNGKCLLTILVLMKLWD